jgi:lysophospholipase L1-like esterase
VWALGDSHTAGVGTAGGGISYDSAVYSSQQQGGLWYQGGSWVPWALMTSGARWTIRGVAATGGYTAAQVLATHVPQILAAAARRDTVVVHAGTNGNVVADVITIHTTLRAAGLNTVAVLIPPNTASSLSAVLAFNEALRTWALTNSVPIADLHSIFADPTTGLWLSAYNNDGTHPNQLGVQLGGQTIAAALNTLLPAGSLLIDHNAAMTGSLQTKPLALGSPVNGTDYSSLSALGTSTIASAAVTGMTGGNGYVFTRGDTDINARMALWTLIAGHRYRLGFAIKADVTSGSWGMRLESNTTGNAKLWGLGYTTNIGTSQPLGRFFSEFTAPASLPDFVYRLRMNIAGAGTVLSIGEVTMFDLTALGA